MTQTPFSDMVAARRRHCDAIARKARSRGLDVNWRKVNRNMALFDRWDAGLISTGYLIRQTGIQPLIRPVSIVRR